jgi:hypothetical protein
MDNAIIELVTRDALWLIIVVGWIFLVLAGLEADKPLSGGIPGHLDGAGEHQSHAETFLDRLGAWGAWAVFGLVSASLPVILWWIFAVHPR